MAEHWAGPLELLGLGHREDQKRIAVTAYCSLSFLNLWFTNFGKILNHYVFKLFFLLHSLFLRDSNCMC